MNPNPELSAELRLLIACCQVNPSKEDIETIRDSVGNLNLGSGNWNDLSALARRHGIFPLFYRSIQGELSLAQERDHLGGKGYADELLSSEITADLKAQNMAIVQRNMMMSAELIRIIQLLEKNSIEALAFKGPALAQMAYGDITLRQYVDLDVLVKKEDIYRAGKILEKNFYAASGSIEFLNDPVWVSDAKDMTFFNQKKGVAVEMHWKFFKNRYANSSHMIDFWLNPSEVKINNTAIRTLQTDILLVYLCIHGSMHVWERIEWIADLDRLVNGMEIDWDKTLILAEQFQSKTMFLLGLSITQELFGTKLPENIQKLTQQKKIVRLKVFTLESLQIEDKEYGSLPGLLRRAKFHATMQDSYTNKFKYWQHTFFHRTIASQGENVKKHSALMSITRPFVLIKRYLFNLKDN